jgi:hypothetical protein
MRGELDGWRSAVTRKGAEEIDLKEWWNQRVSARLVADRVELVEGMWIGY